MPPIVYGHVAAAAIEGIGKIVIGVKSKNHTPFILTGLIEYSDG
jgi:hypothetical protein